MTFNFIFVRDFQENVFIKVMNNAEMVLRTPIVRYFYKDMFLEVPDEK